MVLPEITFPIDDWLKGEKLKLDGSNFSAWVIRLFDLLGENNVADYMTCEMYLEPPYSHETQEQRDLRYRRRVMATFISVTMRLGMEDGLWPMVGSLKPRLVMAHLRSHFVEQVRMWEYELMGDFLSIKMEEGSSLDEHLLRLDDAYMSCLLYTSPSPRD